jgi:hypothetical protein
MPDGAIDLVMALSFHDASLIADGRDFGVESPSGSHGWSGSECRTAGRGAVQRLLQVHPRVSL